MSAHYIWYFPSYVTQHYYKGSLCKSSTVFVRMKQTYKSIEVLVKSGLQVTNHAGLDVTLDMV